MHWLEHKAHVSVRPQTSNCTMERLPDALQSYWRVARRPPHSCGCPAAVRDVPHRGGADVPPDALVSPGRSLEFRKSFPVRVLRSSIRFSVVALRGLKETGPASVQYTDFIIVCFRNCERSLYLLPFHGS